MAKTFVCDACGREDENGFNDFRLNHSFGYGSQHDLETVEASICDDCLYSIIKEKVPNARFGTYG